VTGASSLSDNMSTSIEMGSEVGGVSLPLPASMSMSEDGLESGVLGVTFGSVFTAEEVFVDPEDA
jgi:hypothetical protein